VLPTAGPAGRRLGEEEERGGGGRGRGLPQGQVT